MRGQRHTWKHPRMTCRRRPWPWLCPACSTGEEWGCRALLSAPRADLTSSRSDHFSSEIEMGLAYLFQQKQAYSLWGMLRMQFQCTQVGGGRHGMAGGQVGSLQAGVAYVAC